MLQFLIEYLETIDSTNEELKRRLRFGNMPEGVTLIAHNQLNGKGQRGNSWQAAQGENITLSIFLRPDFLKNHELFYLQRMASLAVCKTVEDLLEVDAKIKWPNDVLINHKKVSGILLENTFHKGHFNTIIGIGLNVNSLINTVDLPNAVSLRMIAGKVFNLQTVISLLLNNLKAYYKELRKDKKSIVQSYNESLYGLGEKLKFLNKLTNQPIEAQLLGVDELGRLVLQNGTEIECHLNGELILETIN